MLPCVCSVIDHRWRQNVVRTKKWHTRRSRVCHWCSYHSLTSSVIYYWTEARQHGIYLFYIIKKLKYTEKMPFISNFATLTDTKIALTWSYVYKKWSELIGCYASQRIVIGSNSKFKKFKKSWIERCRHLCVCPLIDHRREPIRMRELLGLLYNYYIEDITCPCMDMNVIFEWSTR